MPREFGRDQRVADFIQRELASLLQFDMKDPRVRMVTVNDVRVSRDLGYADVYVSSLQTTEEAERVALIDALTGAAGWLRSQLAARSSMRSTPRLRFHWDALPESSSRMDRLIGEALASDRAHDGDEH